jgi:glutaryl-CoA dehydrogenase
MTVHLRFRFISTVCTVQSTSRKFDNYHMYGLRLLRSFTFTSRRKLQSGSGGNDVCQRNDSTFRSTSLHTNAFNGTYDWLDPFQLHSNGLTSEERAIQKSVRHIALMHLQPGIVQLHRNEPTVEESRQIMQLLGNQSLFGVTLPEKYTHNPTLGYVSYGLITAELERIDSSYRSAVSVQSSLVMYPIAAYAQSDTIRQQYVPVPHLASGKYIGCFGLTEANHGSDPGGMETKATYDAGTSEYVLNGHKTWITNAPIADVFIIWAKNSNDNDTIRGYIVEKDTPGLTTRTIQGKFSLRASCTGMVYMDNVRVPKSHQLVINGLKGPFSCLNHARYGIAWGVLGAAEYCMTVARQYTLDRIQFGRPLASTQLIQKKLADMSTDIAVTRQACYTVGRLMESHGACHEQISMIKRLACSKALDIARTARDMLGANGISDEYHIIRHVLNLEAVNTYEGTNDIHALILGRAITGQQAFS